MLVLGHAGITLAVAKNLENAFSRVGLKQTRGYVDYRLVVVGSLLPDLIDKPIGRLILAGVFQNGRLYAHTLFFLAMLSLFGILYWSRFGRMSLLILALGSAVHDVLDMMWLYPETLYWPLYGWRFPLRGEDWFHGIFGKLLSDPAVYLLEITGGIIVGYFAATLICQKEVRSFLLTGQFIKKGD